MSDNPSAQPRAALAAFAPAAELATLRDLLERLQQPCAALLPGGPAEATAWCSRQAAPEVLLVDISAQAHPLAALLRLAEQAGPACRLIAIGSEQDIDLYRQLLQAGIVDYLLKPLRLDLLAATLARARSDLPLGQDGSARTGRSVAVVGSAGGLGCSTLVAALGLWLSAQRHVPCVLVDLDRRKSDLALLLGLEADGGLSHLLEAPSIDPRLLQRTLLDTPASDGAAGRLRLLAERPGADSPIDPERALELGAALGQLYTLALWDLPAHRPGGADEILRHAEVRVVLTELSVQGARNSQRLLAEIGDESQGQSLLLVASALRLGHQPALDRAQFEDFVGRAVDLQLPHAGAALPASLLQGALVSQNAPAYHAGVQLLGHRLLGLPSPVEQTDSLALRLRQWLGLQARDSRVQRA
jgi:pilus assembly protein CpaE